jgi:Sulfotransferase domain
MTAVGSGVARTRELLGRYVAECPYFWARNTDKRQCTKLWRHVEAIERVFGLGREQALDRVVEYGEARMHDPRPPVYVSGRGGSGSHWLGEMLGDLGPFANAGEVSIPNVLSAEIAPWPLEQQALFVDCVYMLHAWAGQPYPDSPSKPREDIAQLHVVNTNGDSQPLRAKFWQPDCVFIHLVRDPRDQVMSFTHRKPGSRANYPIEPLEEFLRLMLIFNRTSLAEVVMAPVHPDLVCRYEELRDDAAPSLRRIVARAGVDVSHGLIEEVAFRHSAEARRQGVGSALGNLSKTPTKTWRESATGQERLLMHAGLAEVVDTLGYELDDCAGRPLEFSPVRSAVELRLADDVVLGELHVRWSHESGWERMGYAAGEVTIPQGAMVRLRCPSGWSAEPSRMTELLPPGCVSSVCFAGNSTVRDADVARLARWSGLIELDLGRTRVTDACIEDLAAIETLRHVSVVGSGVSAEGADRLRRGRPDCVVSAAPLITDAIRGRHLFDEDRTTEPPQ